MINKTSPADVIRHSRKRKNKNPSLDFLGIRNPKKALEKAHRYLNLITDFITLKVSKETQIIFLTDNEIRIGAANAIIRTPGRKGQLDFHIFTENEEFLNYDYFDNYTQERLNYHSLKEIEKKRYYLSDLRGDLLKSSIHTKLVYVIFTSPKFEKVGIFTLEQLTHLRVIEDRSSSLAYCEDIVDFVDEYHIRISKITKKMPQVKNPCPNCGEEWNGEYCRCCGHPH